MRRIIFGIVFGVLATLSPCFVQGQSDTSNSPNPLYFSSSSEKIPVRYPESRILILGGSSGAVAAAIEAKNNGYNVTIASPYPYLGDDVIGTLRFQLEEGEVVPEGPIGDAIYGMADENGQRKQPDLETIKRNLDQVMREHGINVLYETAPVGIIRDMASGLSVGVVFADDNGRFAVVAMTILDATPTARLVNYIMGNYSGNNMNVTFSTDGENDDPFAKPPETPDPGENDKDAKIAVYEDIEYYTIGGERQEISREKFPFLCESKCETSAIPYVDKDGREYPVHRYSIKIGRPSRYFENKAPFVEYMNKLEIQLSEALCGEDTLFAADDYFKIPNLRLSTMDTYEGEWTGPSSLPQNVFRLKIQGSTRNNVFLLNGYVGLSRPLVAKMLRPVNMIVIGKRLGKALSVGTHPAEPIYQTSQAITRNHLYYRINSPLQPGGDTRIIIGEDRQGFLGKDVFTDITEPFMRANTEGCDILVIGRNENGIEAAKTAAVNGAKVVFLASFGTPRDKIRDPAAAGVDVWFDTIPFAAVFDAPAENATKANYPVGVLAHTTQGQFIFRAKILIDATPSGRIARAAGAKTAVDHTPLAFVDSGLPRKIRTELEFSALDFLLGKTSADTISRFEGAFTNLRPYMIGSGGNEPESISLTCSIPLNSCVPKGIDRVFLAGEAIGGTRDAVMFIEEQGAMKKLEAGIAFAALTALETSRPLNDLPIRSVQQKIVAKNLLPETVLTEMDNTRKILEILETAIAVFPENPELTPLILWQPGRSLRPLRENFDKTNDPTPENSERKMKYALALAACGDSYANDFLLGKLESESTEWNKSIAQTVRLLGNLKEYRAVPAIERLLNTAEAKGDFARKRICLAALLALGEPTSRTTSLIETVNSIANSQDASKDAVFFDEADLDKIWTAVIAAKMQYKTGHISDQSRRILEYASRHPDKELARFAAESLKEKID